MKRLYPKEFRDDVVTVGLRQIVSSSTARKGGVIRTLDRDSSVDDRKEMSQEVRSTIGSRVVMFLGLQAHILDVDRNSGILKLSNPDIEVLDPLDEVQGLRIGFHRCANLFYSCELVFVR